MIAAQRKLSLISAFAVVLVAAAGCPEPTAEPPPPTPDAGPPVVDCNNYTFRGEVYNCGAVDRCNLTDFETALACCECNPLYCDPDPTCPVDPGEPPVLAADTCMGCHNGSTQNNYAGPGISNPHPFGVQNIACTGCHGGDGTKASKLEAHVPPPPQVGDRQNQQVNPEAWFNRLSMAGLDKYPDYTVNGVTYEALDYINFINPGDLRIVKEGRGCGACHQDHSWSVANASPIGTEIGFFSSSPFHMGVDNALGNNDFFKTAADYTYRPTDNTANFGGAFGEVPRTLGVPEHAGYNGPWLDNQGLTAAGLAADIITAAEDPDRVNSVRTGSNLAKLYQTQITITCGDCHAGSAGANNRYADFRSSGCTACHMEYSMDGRSRSTDPNVPKFEPANPDAIAAPERPHVDSHQVRNVARILPNGGGFIRGISDRACVGCHQGSNRTVLQYWGIRLDQNQDLVNNFQYPANPVTFVNTAQDTRLFDPTVQNNTFNGRNANQYILLEDYDGDGRDDTPPDVHYEAGLGCIDCHGSRDVHAGTEGANGFAKKIMSRMDQVVQVRCESCHGELENYAPTAACTTYLGAPTNCVVDAEGNVLRNTERDNQGNYWLTSRVDGQRHYIPQTKDTVVQNNKRNPLTNQLVFNANASYAMGRFDGNLDNGLGPQQTVQVVSNGFSHTDNMDCMSCHASWNNQCIGCHLRTQYDDVNYFFSNLTGERIVQKQQNADFTYISPVQLYLGVNSKNKITSTSAGMKTFYAYIDINGNTSNVFAFTDRNGQGNNPNAPRNAHPGLGMYQMAAHSVRGKVQANNEGPRYCVACHNTTEGLANFGADYAQFVTDYTARNYANLDFALLQAQIGQNPGNQNNSPFYVHAAAGLGTGLFLFDANGCPVNPLDNNPNRFFCNGVTPAQNVANNNFNNVAYDTDRMVEVNGVSNVMSLHPMLEVPTLRGGAFDQFMAGPLGGPIINKLTNPNQAAGGVVLDSWLDADGQAQGNAANFIQ